jgi:hypothetical protein
LPNDSGGSGFYDGDGNGDGNDNAGVTIVTTSPCRPCTYRECQLDECPRSIYGYCKLLV